MNLNGKVRVAYWARSALDPKVRVPQFWNPLDFKTALKNKEVVRKVSSTDAKGKEHEKANQKAARRLLAGSPEAIHL